MVQMAATYTTPRMRVREAAVRNVTVRQQVISSVTYCVNVNSTETVLTYKSKAPLCQSANSLILIFIRDQGMQIQNCHGQGISDKKPH